MTSETGIRPLGNRVAIQKLPEQNQTTKGGIIVPYGAKERGIHRGRILAVGKGMLTSEGVWLAPEVEVNDLVVYQSASGIEINEDDEQVFMLFIHELIAVVGRHFDPSPSLVQAAEEMAERETMVSRSDEEQTAHAQAEFESQNSGGPEGP